MENGMRLRRIAITGTAALALVAGSTTADATVIGGPVGSSGVVHGCYVTTGTNGSHAFVLQNVGSKCASGSTPVSWNKTGPQGVQGVQGPAGPSTAGPGGLAVTVVSNSGNGSAEAFCPAAEPYVISGSAFDLTDTDAVRSFPVATVGGSAGAFGGPENSTGEPYGWEGLIESNNDLVLVDAVCSA
jgi:hypothetical protein